MTLLILRLEGVMQSWGTRSRFDDRDTAETPTKSGVIGLLACAFGYPRGDSRITALDGTLSMGVRADRPGRLSIDYQTITRTNGHLINADGKERVVPGKRVGSSDTIVSKRQYLQDGCYLVALAGAPELLSECAEALKDPAWQVFLGRKSCPPSRPVFETLTDKYASIEHALREYPPCGCLARRYGARVSDAHRQMYCEVDDPRGPFMRQDVIRMSGVQYDKRRVRIFSVESKAGDAS